MRAASPQLVHVLECCWFASRFAEYWISVWATVDIVSLSIIQHDSSMTGAGPQGLRRCHGTAVARYGLTGPQQAGRRGRASARKAGCGAGRPWVCAPCRQVDVMSA